MRIRRAFSLIEVVLASTLLLLLLGTLVSILIPMLRASEKGNELSDLRQMAALCLETVAEDVEQSGAAGMAVYSTPGIPQALSVHQVLGLNADGSALWERTVRLYAWDQPARRVDRHVFPPVGPGVTAPTQAKPYRFLLPELAAALGSPRQMLASDVVKFEVSGLSTHGLKPPLVLSIELHRNNSSFTLQQSALPGVRNLH